MNYDNFLSSVERVLQENQLRGQVADLDKELRDSISANADTKAFVVLREHVRAAANELIGIAAFWLSVGGVIVGLALLVMSLTRARGMYDPEVR